MTEQKTYAEHLAEIHNAGEQYAINTTAKTSTGNQCAYWLAGHHGINAPVWEWPIGPESAMDLLHAEALEIDRENFPNVHIHWEESSRDCDGGHGDYGIYRPNADQLNDDGSVDVYAFWNAEIAFMVNGYAIEGTLKVSQDPYSRDDGVAEWSEVTEEGYRNRAIRLCSDDCETPRNTVYDQYAQEAGY